MRRGVIELGIGGRVFRFTLGGITGLAPVCPVELGKGCSAACPELRDG